MTTTINPTNQPDPTPGCCLKNQTSCRDKSETPHSLTLAAIGNPLTSPAQPPIARLDQVIITLQALPTVGGRIGLIVNGGVHHAYEEIIGAVERLRTLANDQATEPGPTSRQATPGRRPKRRTRQPTQAPPRIRAHRTGKRLVTHFLGAGTIASDIVRKETRNGVLATFRLRSGAKGRGQVWGSTSKPGATSPAPSTSTDLTELASWPDA